jgi:hypothetical protein
MTQEGRNILIRVEMHLARWWAETCADGRRGEGEDFIRAFKTVRSLKEKGQPE